MLSQIHPIPNRWDPHRCAVWRGGLMWWLMCNQLFIMYKPQLRCVASPHLILLCIVQRHSLRRNCVASTIWFVHLWGGGLVIIHIWFYLMMYKIFPLYWYSPCTSAIYDVTLSPSPLYLLWRHHTDHLPFISPWYDEILSPSPPFPSLIIERLKYSYKKKS